jgi:RHS repeat-associated protein
MRFTGAYQDSSSGEGNYYLRARNYNPTTGRFTSVDPAAQQGSAASAYTYADNNPTSFTDPTGMQAESTGTGPSPEDVTKAQQLQSKSVLDIILEAGGQILMEFLGINDLMSCLKGNLGSCVMLVVGSLPWGKIFKAKKIGEAIFRAGKAVVTFLKELDWARAIIRGAERAAEAAKAAAALAARQAAQKAAAAKAAAEAAAKKAAERAAARAKAAAAKAKAATKKSSKKAEDATDDALPACPIRNSFVAWTLVLLATGTSKPIDEVQPGDTVLAGDPATGETEPHQVTAAIHTDADKRYVDLTIQDGAEQHTISTTDHHPFWSATQGRWVDAGDLKPGELLRTAAGSYVQIGAVRTYQGQRATYNLTVDDLHTYYVVAGNDSVLVHNNNCPTLDERAHARASENAARSSRPDQATGGYLSINGHPTFDLASDRLHPLIRANMDEIPAAARPGGGRFFGSHVEVQAATLMRILAKQAGPNAPRMEARLMVSKPGGPCSFCASNLAGMLPRNSSLTVHSQLNQIFSEIPFVN